LRIILSDYTELRLRFMRILVRPKRIPLRIFSRTQEQRHLA
jgi:hypothetical protein